MYLICTLYDLRKSFKITILPEHWRIDVLKCGVGEDSWESLELQGDPTSPFLEWTLGRPVLGVHWKDWC